jgi:acetylornithine deacetylase/succinyl-diaminopimelate desuccinylase-like protein
MAAKCGAPSTLPRVHLQDETADVLARLVRFDTVNPPGNERALLEWLAGYLSDAGLEVDLLRPEPDRPSLIARLRGAEPGPVLGYLNHVDTVLASPEDWQHDPWGGEVHDGFLWGRGALDMKSQTAAEAVAAATLARSGRRPARGELKLMCVADEEVGGTLGARWLTEEHPDRVRCDYLLNEGGGAVMPYADRRLYGVCTGEKGTFRFRVRTHGRAGHASLPGFADNALVKLAPVLERLATTRADHDLTDAARVLLEVLAGDASDPDAAIAEIEGVEPRLAVMVDPTLRVTAVPTRIFASEKINVIPAHAELLVDCRVPPGMGSRETHARVRELLGPDDGFEVEYLEQVVGNGSPAASPLMDAIGEWLAEHDPGAETVPVVLPAFTDSRWYRAAFPDCVAYGFFPQRHQTLYETWPLVHGADERIDVRDLGFAAGFFHDLPGRLLG